MAFDTGTAWKSPRSASAVRVTRRIIFFSVVIGLSYAAFEAAHSPKLRKYMPQMALKSIAHAQEAYVKLLGKDLIVESSAIQAKKIVHADLRRSRFGMIQEKRFRIHSNLEASVKVESIDDPKVAKKVFRARGGSNLDQLGIGQPSFVESHGLNNKYNYFIRAISYQDERIITVTVERKLSGQEQERALGSNYDAIMGDMAAVYLDRVGGIAKRQMSKLAQIK